MKIFVVCVLVVAIAASAMALSVDAKTESDPLIVAEPHPTKYPGPFAHDDIHDALNKQIKVGKHEYFNRRHMNYHLLKAADTFMYKSKPVGPTEAPLLPVYILHEDSRAPGNMAHYVEFGPQVKASGFSMSFTAKAKSDIHIAFLTSQTQRSNDGYEVVIGGWGNHRSVIRHGTQGKELAADEKAGRASVGKYWIHLTKDNSLFIGAGKFGGRTFLSAKLPQKYSGAFHIGFGGWESEVVFSDVEIFSGWFNPVKPTAPKRIIGGDRTTWGPAPRTPLPHGRPQIGKQVGPVPHAPGAVFLPHVGKRAPAVLAKRRGPVYTESKVSPPPLRRVHGWKLPSFKPIRGFPVLPKIRVKRIAVPRVSPKKLRTGIKKFDGSVKLMNKALAGAKKTESKVAHIQAHMKRNDFYVKNMKTLLAKALVTAQKSGQHGSVKKIKGLMARVKTVSSQLQKTSTSVKKVSSQFKVAVSKAGQAITSVKTIVAKRFVKAPARLTERKPQKARAAVKQAKKEVASAQLKLTQAKSKLYLKQRVLVQANAALSAAQPQVGKSRGGSASAVVQLQTRVQQANVSVKKAQLKVSAAKNQVAVSKKKLTLVKKELKAAPKSLPKGIVRHVKAPSKTTVRLSGGFAHHQPAGFMASGNNANYNTFSNQKVSARGFRLAFTAQTESDIHVVFTEKKAKRSDRAWEVVIGGWSDRRSVIRMGTQGRELSSEARKGRCGNKKGHFWIQVLGGTMTVGQGSFGQGAFLSAALPTLNGDLFVGFGGWSHTVYLGVDMQENVTPVDPQVVTRTSRKIVGAAKAVAAVAKKVAAVHAAVKVVSQRVTVLAKAVAAVSRPAPVRNPFTFVTATSSGDPHTDTFDGWHHDVMGQGWFTYAKNDILNVQGYSQLGCMPASLPNTCLRASTVSITPPGTNQRLVVSWGAWDGPAQNVVVEDSTGKLYNSPRDLNQLFLNGMYRVSKSSNTLKIEPVGATAGDPDLAIRVTMGLYYLAVTVPKTSSFVGKTNGLFGVLTGSRQNLGATFRNRDGSAANLQPKHFNGSWKDKNGVAVSKWAASHAVDDASNPPIQYKDMAKLAKLKAKNTWTNLLEVEAEFNPFPQHTEPKIFPVVVSKPSKEKTAFCKALLKKALKKNAKAAEKKKHFDSCMMDADSPKVARANAKAIVVARQQKKAAKKQLAKLTRQHYICNHPDKKVRMECHMLKAASHAFDQLAKELKQANRKTRRDHRHVKNLHALMIESNPN